MASTPRYTIMQGAFEIVHDRDITINGVPINVPETGKAHIGIELRLHDGKLISYVRELKGCGGGRFGFLHIGDQELNVLRGMLTCDQPTQVPFMFQVPFPRPKMTLN